MRSNFGSTRKSGSRISLSITLHIDNSSIRLGKVFPADEREQPCGLAAGL